LTDPWLLQLDTSGAGMYLFASGGTGGPLAGPTDLNPTGSGHATGRYFLLQLQNVSGSSWNHVRLDLEFTPNTPSSTHDALSFGEGTVVNGDPDLLGTFSSNRFANVGRVPEIFIPNAHDVPSLGTFDDSVTDALLFTGGTVQPNETVTLLFAINNGVPVGVLPHFYLHVQAGPEEVPEPATVGVAGLALAAFAAARFRRKGPVQ
jgi:hypothetical protein